MVHWPVVVMYPEVMTNDSIEDFHEAVTIEAHLDQAPPHTPLSPGPAPSSSSCHPRYPCMRSPSYSRRKIRRTAKNDLPDVPEVRSR